MVYETKTVLIEVRTDITSYMSDLLCWVSGYIAGARLDDSSNLLLGGAVMELKDLNSELKRAIVKSIEQTVKEI
jgi:hypothetical protein